MKNYFIKNINRMEFLRRKMKFIIMLYHFFFHQNIFISSCRVISLVDAILHLRLYMLLSVEYVSLENDGERESVKDNVEKSISDAIT